MHFNSVSRVFVCFMSFLGDIVEGMDYRIKKTFVDKCFYFVLF